MHVRNKLNVKQIAKLTTPGVYSDGGGLYLRVRPSGTRSWLFINMIRGKRRELGLGSVLDVSLAQARTKAAEARAILLDGRDPIIERRIHSKAVPTKPSFRKFAEEHIDAVEQGFRNEKHRKQWRSTIERYAGPILDKPIDEVSTEAILEVLQPIWLTKTETASRVRGRIERILDAAKAKGYRSGENPARWRGHLDLLLPKQGKIAIKHHAALALDKVPDFMDALRRRPAMAARALEFTILTAARSGETLGMTWSEIDIENRLWTVPAERMKAGAAHQVPLSEAAITILKSVRPVPCDPAEFVFLNSPGKALSNMSMAMLLRRMEYTEITVHGFRSTFRDWAGDHTRFAREDIEMALAHTIASKTERAYRRGRSLEKRRALMDAWAAHCEHATAAQKHH